MFRDWFGRARFFKEREGNRLSDTDFTVLEHQDFPSATGLQDNIEVKAVEIPGIYRVQEDYNGYSGFRFFMDGVQRTVLWQYYNYEGAQVPIYLHFSGAAVMERVRADTFKAFDEAYRSEILVPSFLFEELGGLEGVSDTGAEKCWDLNELRGMAKVKSKALRQELELELVNRFTGSDAGRSPLIKDGNLIGTARKKRVLGLIKTHQTLYLQECYPQIQQMVWNMGEYYRSNVFTIRQKEGDAWNQRSNSFYLRIHPPLHPEMGLLRVEYESSCIPVDELSSWLIAERCIRPNCSRWDRQIYPIQICEEYLRTQVPSSAQIKAQITAMGG